jgi:SAM-dependent MidA family methyltransferase
MKNRLLARIAAEGPLPFEEFMREALYGSEGFFASMELRSVKGGDFLTSPEVSPLFGETIGAFVRAEMERIGDPFLLVEVAGGSGSLLRPLLGVQPVEARAVEESPAARAALTEILGSGLVHSSLDALPSPFRGVVVANELIDNLPMAIGQLTSAGWRERWVGADGSDLVFVDAPVRPAVGAWLDRWAGPVEEGGWVEVQLEAGAWVIRALSLMEAGSLVLFDYGDTMENLAPRRRDGTLRTYRAHHLGPHPLDEPGATDITADVNFTALSAAAAGVGADVEVARQDDWLFRWGLRERISELRHQELELARTFDDIPRLAVRSAKQEAETLVNPRGLGDFRVLVATIPASGD